MHLPHIRPFTPEDWPTLWSLLEPTFRAGDTYAYAPDILEADARKLWIDDPLQTLVATDPAGEVLGTYFIKQNQPGLGSHVCNCGYVVADRARGRGIAAALCEHSQNLARSLGFYAMQFNLVVATNAGAVHLWKKLGFQIVGTLPGAFQHMQLGFVDAYVMYKVLNI